MEGVKMEGVKMELAQRNGVKKEEEQEQSEGVVTRTKPDPAPNDTVKLESGTPQAAAQLKKQEPDDDVKVKTEDDEHVLQLPTSPQVKTEDTT